MKVTRPIGHLIPARPLLAGLLAIAIGACAAMGKAGADDQAATLQVGSLTRTYSVHLPRTPAPPNGYPVVLAFHGGGMQGEGMRRLTRLNAVADQYGFIAVYPDGIDKHWNDGRSTLKNPQDDVGFIAQLLDAMGQYATIDRNRVYATGLSNGALFTERLGCELSTRITAIAPVAGTLPAEMAPLCHPERPVAVMQIDGTADPIMPYEGGAVKDFGGRGEGGDVLSVQATAAEWARLNRCTSRTGPQALPVTARFDRTRAVRTQYLHCAPGGQVTVISVLHGGHAWPGGPQYAPRRLIGPRSRQFDASQTIAAFFLSQHR